MEHDTYLRRYEVTGLACGGGRSIGYRDLTFSIHATLCSTQCMYLHTMQTPQVFSVYKKEIHDPLNEITHVKISDFVVR